MLPTFFLKSPDPPCADLSELETSLRNSMIKFPSSTEVLSVWNKLLNSVKTRSESVVRTSGEKGLFSFVIIVMIMIIYLIHQSADIFMNKLFRKISGVISHAMGTSYAFLTALLVVIIWAVAGPFFNYSNTWQLAINTGTTIVTFLMVFLIQNTQNRDTKATQLKLDELIRSSKHARNSLINIEQLEDAELELLQQEFTHWRDKYAARLERIQQIKAKRKSYFPKNEEKTQ